MRTIQKGEGRTGVRSRIKYAGGENGVMSQIQVVRSGIRRKSGFRIQEIMS